MTRRLSLLPLTLLGAAGAWAADATYEETFISAFDRSDLMPAMFNYPGGGNSAFDNAQYDPAPFDSDRAANFRVYIKGAKLARVGLSSVFIYDLDSGSVISLDKEKRTFTVQTFARMQRHLNKGPRCVKNCQFFVEDTGRTTNINGIEANEYRISAVVGQGDHAAFLAHATYWSVPNLPAIRSADRLRAKLRR